MPIEMINIGFGNMVSVSRVIAVTRSDSSPIKRLIEGAERELRLIDATNGRRTRSVVVLDSNHVVLSHVQPRTLASKLRGLETDETDSAASAEARQAADGDWAIENGE